MKKTLRNDLIWIISLVVILVGSLLAVLLTRKKNNLVAKIYVKDELVQTIDLVKTDNTEFVIHGAKGDLTVSIKDHSIAVIDADCPHQNCVHMGYVKESNRPIICAYNQVYIIIEGNSNYDISI